MTADSVSPICSLSKSFTAVAIMQLVEDGTLWLDEPVVSYLPDFRLADAEASKKITPRLLLSHKSGIARTGHQDLMFDKETLPPYRDRADLVARLVEVQPRTPPNGSYAYCNEGYVILSVLLERLTGASLEDHIERRIFQPVGMCSSVTRFAQYCAAPDRVTNYVKENGGYYQGHLPADYGIYLASGGVCSTVRDLARYAIATLDYAHSPLLSAGSLDQMHAISNPFGDTGFGYGLGWMIAWDGPRKIVWHDGGLPGIATHLLLIPSERLGIVVLTNSSAGDAGQIGGALAADVLGTPLFRPTPNDPLPIRSHYRPASRDALAVFTGTYHNDHGEAWIEVLPVEDHLLVTYGSAASEETTTATAVAIGDAQFMTTTAGDILHFIRGADAKVGSVLFGGDCYRRAGTGGSHGRETRTRRI